MAEPAERERELERIDAMLGALEALLLHIPEHGAKTWTPTAHDIALLARAADLAGPHVPSAALRSPGVVRAFIRAAKGSLERRARQLDPDVD
jgi:hypothetical protein